MGKSPVPVWMTMLGLLALSCCDAPTVKLPIANSPERTRGPADDDDLIPCDDAGMCSDPELRICGPLGLCVECLNDADCDRGVCDGDGECERKRDP